MRFGTLAAVLAQCALCSGCAYLTTYNHPVDLREGSIAMDVKQRVVFSQKRNGPGNTQKVVVCAEPSPDALTVLGATGSLNFSEGERNLGAAAALAESGAFVGLRTQSIQLLRDAMYRLCEGYASGAVGDSDFAAMQRRYQSTMMGLIAIEQLTRPVVASQALLTSAASGQSGASSGDAAVDKAQERAKSAGEASLATQAELDKAAARQEKAQAAARDVRAKLAAELKKKPEDQDAAQVTSLREQESAAARELEDSRLALVDARRRNEAAQEQVRAAGNALRAAQNRVSTSASAGGSLGAVAESSAKSAEHLTKGVVDIVTEINASYTKDACLALLSDLVRSPGGLTTLRDTQSSPGSTLEVLFRSLSTCERILAAEQARVESLPARTPR